MSSSSSGWDPDRHPVHRLIELGDLAAEALNRFDVGISRRWAFPDTPRDVALRFTAERSDLLKELNAFTSPVWKHYRFPDVLENQLYSEAMAYLRGRGVKPDDADPVLAASASLVMTMFRVTPDPHPMYRDAGPREELQGLISGWPPIKGSLIRLLAAAAGEAPVPFEISVRHEFESADLAAELPALSGQEPPQRPNPVSPPAADVTLQSPGAPAPAASTEVQSTSDAGRPRATVPHVSPLAQLNRRRAAAAQVERIGADFWTCVNSVREALQAVVDVPLNDRARWSEAFSTAAVAVRTAGLAAVPAQIPGSQRWANALSAGNYGKASAEEVVCNLLAAAIDGDDGRFAEVSNLLHEDPTISKQAARGLFNVLGYILYQHVDRVSGSLLERMEEARAGITGPLEDVPWHLEQVDCPLSPDAREAVQNLEEFRSGLRFYTVRLQPPAEDSDAEVGSGREELPANLTLDPEGAPPSEDNPPTGGAAPNSDTVAKRPESNLTPDEANIRVRQWLREHAEQIKQNPKFASVRKIAPDIGCSTGMVCNMPAWKSFNEMRKKLLSGVIREVELTDSVIQTRPDPKAVVLTTNTRAASHDADAEGIDWDDDGAVWEHYLSTADTSDQRRALLEVTAKEKTEIIRSWREQNSARSRRRS
jgi:hypothetical protein